MTWTTVARRDGAGTTDSRAVRWLCYLLAFVVVLAAYLYPLLGDEPHTTARFPAFVAGWLTTLVPFVGVVLGYNAVVGDRESGALALTLSLPHSRRDVVLGAFVGRTGVLAAAIVATMAVAGFLVVYPYGELALAPFLGFVALTVAYGAVWTGLAVAISASVATRQRAFVLAFGLLFVFVVVWGTTEAALQVGLNVAGVIEGSLPGPVQFVFDLDPGTLYQRLITGFLDPSRALDAQWYRSKWAALVGFAVWAVAPLALATRRFEGGDLA